MKSIRQVGNCIGLQKNISILEDFFGYTENWRRDFARCADPNQPDGIANLPGCAGFPELPLVKLSVLEYMKDFQNDQNVHLHIRIAFSPNPTINRMIYAMRKVYQKYGLGVVVRSLKKVTLSPDFEDVDVGNCLDFVLFGSTQEQNELYAQFNDGVASNHILVMFVRTLDPPNKGCSTHPPNIQAAVIAQNSGVMTLAHEVGHLLGLLHVDEFPESTQAGCESDNLMTGCGTNEGSVNLKSSQVKKMKDSNLSIKC
jgi:hypothetical protein